MAIRDGSTVTNPRTGKAVRWHPIEPVADEYDYAVSHRSAGYACVGVIGGNAAHLWGTGGHVPWCDQCGAKPGWVYAIDLHVPDPAAFESWFLGRLRAGYYGWCCYFNINNRHWSRSYVKTSGGKRVVFAYAVRSGDDHLHLSGSGGSERTNSSILADWQAHRTGADRPAPKPAPASKPASTSEETDMFIVTYKGAPAHYLTDGQQWHSLTAEGHSKYAAAGVRVLPAFSTRSEMEHNCGRWNNTTPAPPAPPKST